jgi:hypothetical protein
MWKWLCAALFLSFLPVQAGAQVYIVDLNSLPTEAGTGGSYITGPCGTGLHCVILDVSPVYELSGLNIPPGTTSINFGTFTVFDVTICTDPTCSTSQGFFQANPIDPGINSVVVLGPGLFVCIPGLSPCMSPPETIVSLEYNIGLTTFQFETTGGIYTPAVPEPSTWVMFLIGFAGIGFAALRRRAA